MNYLKVSKRLASYTNPDQEGSYDTQIDVIQVVMQLLTFGLILTFCGFGIKKAVEKVKGGGGVSSGDLTADSVLTKIKSSVGEVWRLAGRGKTKTPPEPREQELAVRHPTGMADALPTVVNPMRETLPEGWAEAKSEQGDTYYHNTDTGQTSWTRPTDKKEARLSNL